MCRFLFLGECFEPRYMFDYGVLYLFWLSSHADMQCNGMTVRGFEFVFPCVCSGQTFAARTVLSKIKTHEQTKL